MPPKRGDEEPTLARHNPLLEVAVPRLRFSVERLAGRAAPRVHLFEGEVCRVGSHASNDLVLEDPLVSRFHCRIMREATGWRVLDAGSRNGTRVDAIKVRDAELPDACVLIMGDSQVRVSAREPAAARAVPPGDSMGDLVGRSDAMRRLFAVLARVAVSEIDVSIEGESGTGKELVAREIVMRSPRAAKPFVVVDCGAMSPTLVESELFGHVRGAFTGADKERVGAFEAADGGTVFLDEIGELPLELQPKLLRALEQREVRRLGETRARRVDVRVLSATHRDLEREVNLGRFREDLYFRLAKVCVYVPPLRERAEDVPLLVKRFLTSLNHPDEGHLFSAEVLGEMEAYDWPGNVRELKNYVERTVVMGTAATPARRSTVPPTVSGIIPVAQTFDFTIPFRAAKEAATVTFERAYLRALLDRCGGNLSKAARTVGMDRMHLHQLVHKHGIRRAGSA